MSIADLVDAAAGGPVLVFGSPPPGGRDLDLLVHPDEERNLAAALERAGFERKEGEWVRFAGCSAEAVDLVPAARWQLPADELAALFAEATPVEGYANILEPAPHHQLLILARLGYRPKRLARLERAEEAPGAWFAARERAPRWGLAEELDALALREESARRIPRPRRSLTISLSGLDGAGKSSQAESLVSTLEQLGYEAVVVWSPLGSPLLDLVGRPAKFLLRLLRFGRMRPLAERSATGSVMSGGDGGRAQVLWATFVGVASALEQRRAATPHLLRGRVVIYDRHALDTIVRLRILYGDAGSSRWTRRLLRLASPPARLAFFLDIRAETSIARKDDIWPLAELERHRAVYLEELPRNRVRRLDGEAAREEICGQIGREAWRALP